MYQQVCQHEPCRRVFAAKTSRRRFCSDAHRCLAHRAARDARIADAADRLRAAVALMEAGQARDLAESALITLDNRHAPVG